MKIIIEYDSSWRNSFLDGSNNEPLPKKGRKFVGSMTSLRQSENYKKHEVTIDTVMGVLNRLIGDQRKLYQARKDADHYFFKDLESSITFDDVKRNQVLTEEMTYIRNISGSTDQNSFTGIIKSDDVMFSSDYSKEFWGVLGLEFEEVCQFIIDDTLVNSDMELNPLVIIARLEALNKEKAVENIGLANEAMTELHKTFPDINYQNNKELIMPISIYCSALYLQLIRLEKKYDMKSAKTKAGGISGISKRGFTKKDFMNRFTTGDRKKIWGNPYIRKERIKGIGEVTSLMTKASGTLEIEIPVDKEKGLEIKNMIESAGVSSFYLGKKGLAYVSSINPRPSRRNK
jgi:hypothetical protein